MRGRWKSIARDGVAWALYASGLTRRLSSRRFTIVTFHRVLSPDERAYYPLPSLAVTPEELRWMLALFGKQFECGRLDRMHQRWIGGETFERPPLVVTFDDGHLDNFTRARPVLDELGVKATFFAVSSATETGQGLWHDRAAYALVTARENTVALRQALRSVDLPLEIPEAELLRTVSERLKRLGAAERMRWIADLEAEAGTRAPPTWDRIMTFAQLRELANDGHEIGSHSHTHAILPSLSDEDLADELVLSRQILEARVGQPVTSLGYPNGDADTRVVTAARAAGYHRAVTTAWGRNRRDTDPLRLSRCDMQSTTARSSRGALSSARLAWRISGLHPGLR